MALKISRFERRIIVAILFCALTPFLISSFLVPLIIESRLTLAMHSKVLEQLEASAVFYKEFFGAKKGEYSARAEAIARDPVLIRAARDESKVDVEDRLRQILADTPEIRSLRVYAANKMPLTIADGDPSRQGPDFAPKTVVLPLGLGDAPHIEVDFILSKKYLDDRAHAEEIATLYEASLESAEQEAANKFLAYIMITAFVVIFASAIGYVVARRVTSRVARLAIATERVARGETGFQIPVRGNDEITELSDRFNRMIHEVADARDRIVYLEKVSGWQEFARRLAHEIKNPLTPIRLAIQELRKRAPQEDARFKRLVDDAADVVEEEIGALTRLVGEFSQFARLPEVIPSRVSVGVFLKEFLAAYNQFEPDAQVHLKTPTMPVFAMIDRVLMRRVLANLVENAIQASRETPAKIILSAAADPASHRIVINVKDNGPGIPSDQARKIFDPYFTTKNEGTGLGLAIVKKIVLQHQGTINVEPTDTGASFLIMLPSGP